MGRTTDEWAALLDGTTEWRPFPSDAGEWRRSKNLAEMSVSVAKRDNPDVRSPMSEQRWAVIGDAARGGWIVAHPGDLFRCDGRLECWAVHSLHDTWAEAMQEADRMARTITVTLPRLAPKEWTTAGNFRVVPEPHGWGDALEVDELDDDGAYFIIDAEDCETLALALLAHARKATN